MNALSPSPQPLLPANNNGTSGPPRHSFWRRHSWTLKRLLPTSRVLPSMAWSRQDKRSGNGKSWGPASVEPACMISRRPTSKRQYLAPGCSRFAPRMPCLANFARVLCRSPILVGFTDVTRSRMPGEFYQAMTPSAVAFSHLARPLRQSSALRPACSMPCP